MTPQQAKARSREMMLEERRDLRELLGQLTPDQWRQPSLCAGWTVSGLVAHLVAWDDLLIYRSRREHLRALLGFGTLYARSLGRMTEVNRRLDARVSGLAPAELLQRFAADDSADLKWLFDGANPAAHLAEYVIHHQDIRRALDLPRAIPPDRLVAALQGVTQLPDVRVGAWRRLRQRRWTATDVDWARGRGPTAEAPGEEILMTLAGRPTEAARQH